MPKKRKLLIILILGVLLTSFLGIGAYLIREQQEKKFPPQIEQVTITTDKTEYEQREEVKVTLKNISPKHIWYWQDDKGWFTIQRMEKGAWSAIEKYDPCICGANCESPGFFELKNEIWHTWLQEESCMRNQVAKGEYRAGVRIKINEDTKTVYSNEFTIKEKLVLPSKNCDDYEMPMTKEEIRECFCPEGYQKFFRLSGAYCATNSQKPCRIHTDCPKGEHCISGDRKNWFCTGQFAGCYYRNPENPEEPMLCAD